MENHAERISITKIIILFISGILIGGGAILPGISGGVLCVVFGIYQPMMELLSHPVKAFPKYWRIFVPVLLGWVVGFYGFAKVIEWIFGANETIGTWLFIGLILGTVPALFKEAGEKGRTKGSYISAGVSFLLMLAILTLVKVGVIPQVEPSLPWFLFAGVLWGISLIVPGMSSSPFLIALGLLIPLTNAIAELDLKIIGVWLVGLILTVAILARVVNNLFEKHYSIMYHSVLGITVASTLSILPSGPYTTLSAVLSAVAFAAGLAVAYFMGKWKIE